MLSRILRTSVKVSRHAQVMVSLHQQFLRSIHLSLTHQTMNSNNSSTTSNTTLKHAGDGVASSSSSHSHSNSTLDSDSIDPNSPDIVELAKSIDSHRLASQVAMKESRFMDARDELLKALDIQQGIFQRQPKPETFLTLVKLLSDIVTCIRMSGVNPADLSAIDTVVGIYENGVLEQFIQADASHKSVLEHPSVYTLVCFIAGCYIDGEAFTKAKNLLNKHMLYDLSTSSPSSVEGAYDLKDLRFASALNFIGIAEFSDHSACSGHGHGHHHHHHDHSKATAAWTQALTFTEPFTKMLLASKPIGELDPTDQLMLQATSIILDNLAQVSLNAGKMDEAVAYSRSDVNNLLSAYSPHSVNVVAGQSQLLRTLLESHQMDEAEILCEEMLATFPHPKPGVEQGHSETIPEEVTLDTSRIFDELSTLVYQHQNLDYAEKFLQVSLAIMRARLVDEKGQPITIHPALARAENGLGLIQLQMKDYENAEQHLKLALDIKTKLVEMGIGRSQQTPDNTHAPSDDGLAEFHHNYGLSMMGTKKLGPSLQQLLAAKSKYTQRYTDPATGEVNLVHATYAGLCSQLAQLYRMQGDDKSALASSLEALELKQKLFTPTSTQLIPDLYLTAHIQANGLGDFKGAIPHYKQLISILELPQGRKAPDSNSLGAAFHWLANAYDRTDQIALAADAWRKSILQLEKGMGPREVLPIMRNLLRVVKEIGLEQEKKELEGKISAAEEQLKQQEEAKANAQGEQSNFEPKMTPIKDETDEGAQFEHAK